MASNVARRAAVKSTLVARRTGAAGVHRALRSARSAPGAALIGAALVVLAGIPLAAVLNVWIDEAFTLHTTGAGPVFAWTQAIAFEAQPPLFFVLEALWRTFDETSIGFARLPSVLFAAAAVAVIVGAAARITPRTPPMAVALVTAFNPIVIWAAVELRVYALVLLVGAVLTWAFYEGFLIDRPSRRARLWYVVFAVAGLYTQYYVGFVLAAHFITLLALRRGTLRAFAGYLTIVAAAFAPFVRIALIHAGASGDMVARVSPAHAAHEIANAVFVFILPHDITWSGIPKLIGFALAPLLLVGLSIAGRPALARGPVRAVAAQWLVSLAVFGLVFAACGVPPDSVRHLIVIAPASLLVALIFLSALTRTRRLAGSLAALAFAGFAVALFWSHYAPLSKPGEWPRVAAVLSSVDASTPIAVFPAELAFPLGVYLPRATISIPAPMPFTLDYVRATTLTGEPDVARVLGPAQLRTNQLWLVTRDDCRPTKPDAYGYGCGFLEAYMRRGYRVTRSIVFRGALARLYIRNTRSATASPSEPKS